MPVQNWRRYLPRTVTSLVAAQNAVRRHIGTNPSPSITLQFLMALEQRIPRGASEKVGGYIGRVLSNHKALLFETQGRENLRAASSLTDRVQKGRKLRIALGLLTNAAKAAQISNNRQKKTKLSAIIARIETELDRLPKR